MPLLPLLCLSSPLLWSHPPLAFRPQMLVGIRVLDINDNDPVLLNLPMNITISENSPISSFVTHVLASDADSGCNALLTFNITAGNRERAFFINATVGLSRAPKSLLPEAHRGAPGSRMGQKLPRGSEETGPQSMNGSSSKVNRESSSWPAFGRLSRGISMSSRLVWNSYQLLTKKQV